MSGSIALDSVSEGPSDPAIDGVPITGDAISGGANRSIDAAFSCGSCGVLRRSGSSAAASLPGVRARGGVGAGGGGAAGVGGRGENEGAGGCGGGTSGRPLGIDAVNVG